jgi:hypothetical protein
MNIFYHQQARNFTFKLTGIVRQIVFCFILICLLSILLACTSQANQQATADSMTTVAKDQLAAITREAEQVAATATAEERDTAEAQAAATEEAQATTEFNSTSTAAAESEATIAAQATAAAEATIVAQATAEFEATAEAEATISAQATAQFQATAKAILAQKSAMVEEAQIDAPFIAEQNGSLTHDDEVSRFMSANVNLRNFVAQTQFTFSSTDTDHENGDLCLQIRASADTFACLLISQDSQWQLFYDDKGEREIIQEGELVNLTADEQNELLVYADEDEGFFLLNGAFVDELLLEQAAGKGDIALAIGLSSGGENTGAVTEYAGFAVWSMDPIPPTPTPAPQPTSPPEPVAPPPPAAGMGRIIVINETLNQHVDVYGWTCCEEFRFTVMAGETVVREFPTDEYGWGVSGMGCMRDLPQLFLKNDVDMVLVIVPAEGGCRFALRMGEVPRGN